MKPLLLFLLLIPFFGFSQFHIKVILYACNFNETGWAIKATNNNWKNEIYLNEVIDLTMDGDEIYEGGISVDLDPKLFLNNESAAIRFASKFSNYQQCIQYNLRIANKYDKLLAYYKKHPPKIVKPKPRVPCEYKETLVH